MTKYTTVIRDNQFRIVIPRNVRMSTELGLEVGDEIQVTIERIPNGAESEAERNTRVALNDLARRFKDTVLEAQKK